jgi:hypothetical protein
MTMNYPQRSGKSASDNPKRTTAPNRDINAAQRVQLALQLKAAGMTLDEIAAQAGYGSRAAAHNAIKRELQRNISPKVEEMRQEELHMLKVLHTKMWAILIDSSVWPVNRIQAANTILSISERKSKLFGLDVPVDQAINQNVVVVREVPQGYLGIVEQAQ